MKAPSHLSKQLLEQFSHFIAQHFGIYFSQKKWPELEKKTKEIAEKLGFSTTESCIQSLINSSSLNKDELSVLTQTLTIGETYFFRDEKVFKILQKKILPQIIQNKILTKKSIKIWCAACATGEEAYSIAILVHSILPDLQNWDITILGTDINSFFLQKAQRGQYGKWSFRGMPAEIKKRYFIHEKNDIYSVSPDIKEMVKFSPINLVADKDVYITNKVQASDLILCNNVLIYFSPNQINKVINQLVQSLTKNGWLVVSPIEVSFVHHPDLDQIQYENHIFFSKVSPIDKRAKIPPVKETHKTSIKKEAPVFNLSPQLKSTALIELNQKKQVPASQENCYLEALKFYQQKQYSQTIQKIQEGTSQPEKKEVLLLIKSFANQGDLKTAIHWCGIGLKLDNMDPFLHLLHAQILQELGLLDDAKQSLQKALYLDSNFVMAHFTLANLLYNQGRYKESFRYFRNVLKLLREYPPEKTVLGGEDISAQRLEKIVQGIMESTNQSLFGKSHI